MLPNLSYSHFYLQHLLGGLESALLVDMVLGGMETSLRFAPHTLFPFVKPLFSAPVIPICLSRHFFWLFAVRRRIGVRRCVAAHLPPQSACCRDLQKVDLSFGLICFLPERATSVPCKGLEAGCLPCGQQENRSARASGLQAAKKRKPMD